MEEGALGGGVDEKQAIGLGDLGGDLGKVLGAGHPDGDQQAKLGADPGAHALGDRRRRAEEPARSRDVGERLVDRDAFDSRRIVRENRDRRIAQALVFAEVAAGEDKLRTELTGFAARHAARDPARARFVGGCEHHAAADRDRPAAQDRLQQLLDRRIERVQVRMENRRIHGARFSFCSEAVKRIG